MVLPIVITLHVRKTRSGWQAKLRIMFITR
jgi:hypothetical protein